VRLGQGAETGPVRWCGARNKAIPNRSAAPASTPIGRKGTKNIIRQDVAPRRMRRERKCESKKDPKLYSKALFRKETEPISPGLGLDRRPAASRGIGRLYNLGLQPATTSLFTALTASREPWREDPFFGANNRMPMILKRNQNEFVWTPRTSLFQRASCHICVAIIPGSLILKQWIPCLQASLGGSRIETFKDPVWRLQRGRAWNVERRR